MRFGTFTKLLRKTRIIKTSTSRKKGTLSTKAPGETKPSKRK